MTLSKMKALKLYFKGIKKTLKWYLDNKEWFDNVTSGAYQKYYDTMYSGKEEL